MVVSKRLELTVIEVKVIDYLANVNGYYIGQYIGCLLPLEHSAILLTCIK